MPAIRTGRYLGTHAPRPRVRTERHLESHAPRPRQNRTAPRVPCPATQHQKRTVPRIPPRTTTTIAKLRRRLPSRVFAAKPERRRAPASRPKQRGTAAPRLAERRRGTAAPPCGKTERRRRSTSRTRQNVAAVSTPCLTDKADRRRGRASRLVAKKLTCPSANYLTNALSSANGIANQARGVEGGPQQFASATRKAKPEGSRPETPPNTTPQRTVK